MDAPAKPARPFGRHRKRCLGGFDLQERYRNLPDLHVLRGSDGSS